MLVRRHRIPWRNSNVENPNTIILDNSCVVLISCSQRKIAVENFLLREGVSPAQADEEDEYRACKISHLHGLRDLPHNRLVTCISAGMALCILNQKHT